MATIPNAAKDKNAVRHARKNGKKDTNVFLKAKKEHPLLFLAAALCLLLFFGGFSWKTIYTFNKYLVHHNAAYKNNESKKDTKEFNKIDEIEHVDFEGIFSAALGIFVGIIITASVEQRHDKQNTVLETATHQIQTGVNEINRLVRTLGILVPQTDLDERLKAIQEIIRITKESEGVNNLYILNYNTSFGLLQSYNLNILFDVKPPLLPKSWAGYHKDLHEKYYKRQKKILRDLREIEGDNVIFAILRTGDYKELLGKLFLAEHRHTVKPYYIGNKDSHDFKQMKNPGEGDTYAIPFEKSELSELNEIDDLPKDADKQIKLKEKLINKLVRDNESNINTLKEHYKIAYLDHHDDFVPIPFQFFLTAPKNGNSGVQQCLLIFTNILSAHDHASQTTSFVSTNNEIIQTLMNIHADVMETCTKAENHEQQVRQFFSCADERKPEFILMKIPGPKTNEKTSPGYLADYIAYSDLKELLLKHHVPETTLEHLADEALDKKFEEIKQGQKKDKGTYIVIGLFDNTLAMKLRATGSDGDSFFDFNRDPQKEGQTEVTGEKISIYLNDKGDLCKLLNSTKSETITKSPDQDGKEVTDLALLVKMKVGESTVILCGGLSGLGTSIIGRYLTGHFDEIFEELGKHPKSEEFVIIFDIKQPVSDGDAEPNADSNPEQEIVTIKIVYTKALG